MHKTAPKRINIVRRALRAALTSNSATSLYRGRGLLLLSVMFVLCATSVFVFQNNPTQAATSSHLNFQARLQSINGDIVPDGYYDVEFKLYDALSGGSNLWTENRTGGNQVRVFGGYLSANLGSVTAFPAIDWDQDMYLTMNVAGDGEMTPRMKLTSVPYAFQAQRAASLAKKDGLYTGTVDFSALTGDRTILLPDASGEVCLDIGNCGGTGDISNGGNITGADVVIGTNDAFNLSFETDNTLQLTLDTGGNLDILNGGLYIDGTEVITSGLVLQNVTADTSILTTGILGTARGGTGAGSFTSNGVIYGNGTGALQVTGAGTGGQLLVANASGVPTFVSLSGDASLSDTGALTIANDAVTTLKILDGNVTNAKLQNSSLTVSAGTGLSGGGSVALGGTTTLNLANTAVSAGSYGSASLVATFTVDAQGRLTTAGTTSIALNANQITSGTLSATRGGTGLDTSGATDGQLLIGNGSGFSLATLTQGSGITITNGVGGITIANSLGGSISGAEIDNGSVLNEDLQNSSFSLNYQSTNLSGDSSVALGGTLNIDFTDDPSFNSVTAGTYTGAGAVTLSSGGSSGLTLDSASGVLSIAANDTTLRRQASGAYSIDLSDGSNTTLQVINGGAGVANLTVDGSITTATGLTVTAGGLSVTGNSTITGTLGGLTGLTVASGGASISGGLNNNSGGLTNVGAISGATTLNLSGAITGATTGNTINGLIINSGTLTGVTGITFTSGSLNLANGGITNTGAITGGTTISMSGAISAATATNTINGLIINSGSLSGITGFSQTSGNFSVTGSGSITLGAGSNALTINSSAFSVTSAGAVSGVTTLVASTSLTAPTINATTTFQHNGTNGRTLNCAANEGVDDVEIRGGILITSNCRGFGLSDEDLKENVVSLSSSVLDSIRDVNVVNFDFDCTNAIFSQNGGNYGCDNSTQTGVIAQQLESIFPGLVFTAADGYKRVNYEGLAMYNLKAVQELASLIDSSGDTSFNSVSTGGTMRLTSTGELQNINGLTVVSGGASISGGLNNNSGGITNAGGIGGVAGLTLTSGNLALGGGNITGAGSIAGTSLSVSGTISAATSTNTINGLVINAGALSNITTINAAGLATTVGLNAGNGLIQTTGGLTVTGTTNINTTGSAQINIGNSSTPLVINSSTLNLAANGNVSTTGTLGTYSTGYNVFASSASLNAYGYFRSVDSGDAVSRFEIGAYDISGASQGGRDLVINQLGGNVGVGGDTTPDGLFSVGSASQFQVNGTGTITAATAGNTINGLVVNSGSLTGITGATFSSGNLALGGGNITGAGSIAGTSLSVSGAITAATGSNTINGLVVNAGSLSSVAGFNQTSGNFSISGTGTFGTGTGAISLNGATTVTGSNTFTVNGGLTSLNAGLNVLGNVRLGDPTNYAQFNGSGDLQFFGTGDYLVGANRYAFRYSAGENYGLIFNSTLGRYDFTTGDGSTVFSVNAGDGSLISNGGLSVATDALVGHRTYVPGLTGTSGQGYFTGSPTTTLGGFQSLDLGGNTYSFFGNNKYYNGSAWVDNGLGRTGSSFQIQNDSFTFYSFNTGTTFTPRFSVASGGNVAIGLSGAPAGLLSVGGTTGNFQVSSTGAITAPTTTNTINGLIINSGALTGVTGITFTSGSLNLANGGITNTGAITGGTTITMSGAITAATAGNTINGLIINSGSLSGITGYSQTSGNFSVTGTGSITLGAGSNALTINSSAFDVTSAGAVSGVTTLVASTSLTAPTINATTTFQHNGTNGRTLNCSATEGVDNFESRGGIVITSDCRGFGLSDERLKGNVQELGSVLDAIKNVNVVTFDFDCSNAIFSQNGGNYSCDDGLQTGVIAQELEEVFPGLVYEGADGYKRVKYDQLSIYTLQAVTELAARVDSQGNAQLNGLQTDGVTRLTNGGALQNITTIQVGDGIAIGTTAQTNKLTINDPTGLTDAATQVFIGTGGAANTALGIAGSAGQTADLLQIKNSSNSVLARFMASGAFRMDVGSAVALQINDVGGSAKLTVDTLGNIVRIGSHVGDSLAVLLTLDSKNTAGDPSGVAGAMYYNSADQAFRCYENDQWKNCISRTDVVKGTDQTVSDTASLHDINDLSFAARANATYSFEGTITYEVSSADADLAYTFRVPADATVTITSDAPTGNGSQVSIAYCNQVANEQICTLDVDTNNTKGSIRLRGTVITSSSAGDVSFRASLAQDTAQSGESITIYRGSTLSYNRTQ